MSLWTSQVINIVWQYESEEKWDQTFTKVAKYDQRLANLHITRTTLSILLLKPAMFFSPKHQNVALTMICYFVQCAWKINTNIDNFDSLINFNVINPWCECYWPLPVTLVNGSQFFFTVISTFLQTVKSNVLADSSAFQRVWYFKNPIKISDTIHDDRNRITLISKLDFPQNVIFVKRKYVVLRAKIAQMVLMLKK